MKRDLIVATAFMLAVPFAVLPCGAASCTLLTDAEDGTGDWTDQTRWKDGAMPQAGDDINIRASVTVTDAGRAFTIPCSFKDCAGTENLKNWTLSFDGDPGATWALARADASGLLFAKQGFILIVK